MRSCSVSKLPTTRIGSRSGNRAALRSPLCRAFETRQNDASTTVSVDEKDSTPYVPLAVLSGLGFLETSYLAVSKFINVDVVCPTSGCENVLSSPYAMLFGQPLSIYGALAYGAVAFLALKLNSDRASSSSPAPAPSSSSSSSSSPTPAYATGSDDRLRIDSSPSTSVSGASSGYGSEQPPPLQLSPGLSSGSPPPPPPAPAPARWAFLIGASTLASCSAYLMYVLFGKLGGESCTYCLTSAAISTTIFALAISNFPKAYLDKAGFAAAGVAASLILGLNAAHADVREITVIPYQRPYIENVSSDKAIALAKRLNAAGAKMYGAFWCSHCYEQKETFGAEAMADFPYVECYPDGWAKGKELVPACQAADVRGFPTWVIGGVKIEGDKTLDELEALLDGKAAN